MCWQKNLRLFSTRYRWRLTHLVLLFMCVGKHLTFVSTQVWLITLLSYSFMTSRTYREAWNVYVNLLLEWNPMNECISTLQYIVTMYRYNIREIRMRENLLSLYSYMVDFVLHVLQYSIRKRYEQLYIYTSGS